jgi:hypothetical protein
MKKIYSLTKQATVAVAICLSLFSTQASGQATPPCGTVVEDFQNTGGGTAGFTGNGFTLGSQGSRRFLQRPSVVGNVTYTLTTPTYTLPSSQTVIGYGFFLDGSQKVANINAKILYLVNGQVTTVTLSSFTPTYSGGNGNETSTVCRGVNTSELPGFTVGGSYRFQFEFTPITGAGLSTDFFSFDDFRTTGVLAQAPLPVTFTGFEAKKVANGNQLVWKVAGEENVNHYEVERSTDGRNFMSVSTLYVSKKDTYTYLDADAGSTAYYRIKNVDNDGHFKFSNIARITNGKSSIVITAFPQPAANQLTVQHPAIKPNGLLTISSVDGRVVSIIRPVAGTMQTFVNVSFLQKGMYLLKLDDGDGNSETMKVIKQ